jgi:hypothetical protein
MRYQESVERIGTPVFLEIFGRGQHARGPVVEGIIACVWLRQLLGAIHRQRLCRLG